MTNQDELNQKNEYAKIVAAGLVEMIKANQDKLVKAALKARDGRTSGNYGDTGFARCSRIAKEAVDDLINDIQKAVKKPKNQALPEKKYREASALCYKAKGKLQYELIVAGERIAIFRADNQTDAAMFAESLKVGKHVVKRVTKNQRMQERTSGACSPESETYWCS